MVRNQYNYVILFPIFEKSTPTMTYETVITLDADPRTINVPQIIRIPNHSKLTFKVNDSRNYYRANPYERLSMTIYFDDFMPGFEQRQTVDVPNDPYNNTPTILASGTVQKPGEYKFGVSIQSGGKKLYDVDPYVIVF